MCRCNVKNNRWTAEAYFATRVLTYDKFFSRVRKNYQFFFAVFALIRIFAVPYNNVRKKQIKNNSKKWLIQRKLRPL